MPDREEAYASAIGVWPCAVVGLSALLAAAACSTAATTDRARAPTGRARLRSSPGGPTAARRPAWTAWSPSSARTVRPSQFVNGAVAGGAGSNAKTVLAPRLTQSDPPDTFQAHAGAELTDYINAGQVEDLSAGVQGLGPDHRVPEGPDRQPDGRRQDLLGAGEHPPGQRAVGQQDGAGRRRHHQATPTTLDAFFADLDKLKAKGVDPAGRRARTGPS